MKTFSFLTSFCFLKCLKLVHIIIIFFNEKGEKVKTHTRATTDALFCQLLLLSACECSIFTPVVPWGQCSGAAESFLPCLAAARPPEHPAEFSSPPGTRSYLFLLHWLPDPDSEIWLRRGQAWRAMSLAGSSSAVVFSPKESFEIRSEKIYNLQSSGHTWPCSGSYQAPYKKCQDSSLFYLLWALNQLPCLVAISSFTINFPPNPYLFLSMFFSSALIFPCITAPDS